MILAVIIGVSMGLGLRSQVSADDKKTIFYLKFPGDLLLNMLKMLILPLIVSSLISAMSGLKAQASGRMGFRTLIYYFVTTFCAVIIGIVLVVAIEPGKKRESAIERSGSSKAAEGLSSLLDLIRYLEYYPFLNPSKHLYCVRNIFRCLVCICTCTVRFLISIHCKTLNRQAFNTRKIFYFNFY